MSHTFWIRLRSHWALWRHPLWLAAKFYRWLKRRAAKTRYQEKLAANDSPSVSLPASFPLRLTVVMPVFRVPEPVLRLALNSVRVQSYSDFEFLLLNDASPDPYVARVLEQAGQEDRRVRVMNRRTTGGLSRAANDLVAQAKGDFVAFLDHDDLLHPRALEAIASALSQDPNADWLFTDEDKINMAGSHHDPCCKLGFSHHLLLSWNYVCHFRVVRKELIAKVGGFREGFEGAQDWDLALRVLAVGGKFRHVPGVLYHWRVSPSSMAAGIAAKPTANHAAQKSIEEHLAKLLPPAVISVSPMFFGASVFRAFWVPEELPEVGILLPKGEAPPKWSNPQQIIPVEEPAKIQSWQAALARAWQPVVVSPVPRMKVRDLQTLVAFLLLPGTVAASGRFLNKGRVTCSGWIKDTRGTWRDPWQGLAPWDPGYCNLAFLPQPRSLLPPKGWAAWRQPLLDALAAPSLMPGPWCLPEALASIPGEKVVTPWVNFWGRQPSPAPLFPLKMETTLAWPALAEELGLFP